MASLAVCGHRGRRGCGDVKRIVVSGRADISANRAPFARQFAPSRHRAASTVRDVCDRPARARACRSRARPRRRRRSARSLLAHRGLRRAGRATPPRRRRRRERGAERRWPPGSSTGRAAGARRQSGRRRRRHRGSRSSSASSTRACASRLAQRIEPYLPSGTRLWGKSRIGLRCIAGPSAWNVYLPITVKAYGRALGRDAPASRAGSVLQPSDLTRPKSISPKTAARPSSTRTGRRPHARAGASPGQSLRHRHLKARQWFAAGDTVTAVAIGAGFALEGEGQALSNGIEGQPARVRTENGRVVTGRPVGERRLELAL